MQVIEQIHLCNSNKYSYHHLWTRMLWSLVFLFLSVFFFPPKWLLKTFTGHLAIYRASFRMTKSFSFPYSKQLDSRYIHYFFMWCNIKQKRNSLDNSLNTENIFKDVWVSLKEALTSYPSSSASEPVSRTSSI